MNTVYAIYPTNNPSTYALCITKVEVEQDYKAVKSGSGQFNDRLRERFSWLTDETEYVVLEQSDSNRKDLWDYWSSRRQQILERIGNGSDSSEAADNGKPVVGKVYRANQSRPDVHIIGDHRHDDTLLAEYEGIYYNWFTHTVDENGHIVSHAELANRDNKRLQAATERAVRRLQNA